MITIISDWSNKPLVCFVCGETKSVKYENENGEPICNFCVLKQIGGEELVQEDKQCTIGNGSHVRVIDGSLYNHACGYITDSFLIFILNHYIW